MAKKHSILVCDDQVTIRTSLGAALTDDGISDPAGEAVKVHR